jgi:esterase/lipase superfamily enzyme
MIREYHKWYSSRVGREMELLAFGHAGEQVLVFPTSGGRFYEFEDRGMVAALAGKIESGDLQVFCVDSINMESWYNRAIHPRMRIGRHMQYEQYLLNEVLPMIRGKMRGRNHEARPLTLGCSFGGYHAVNLALRRPEIFSGYLSLSGAFDLSPFLDGYYDEDCYYHLPTHYLPRLTDPWFLDRFCANRFVLATGWDDHCLKENQILDRILGQKAIPHRFDVWEAENSHDWPTWRRMVAHYLL